jgi:hypothetical protein
VLATSAILYNHRKKPSGGFALEPKKNVHSKIIFSIFSISSIALKVLIVKI